MQNPDGQQDAAILDAVGIRQVADAVHASFINFDFDLIADEQVLVRLVGGQPLRHALMVQFSGEAREISCTVRPPVSGIKIMQDAIADQRRHMGRGRHQQIVKEDVQRAFCLPRTDLLVAVGYVVGPILPASSLSKVQNGA